MPSFQQAGGAVALQNRSKSYVQYIEMYFLNPENNYEFTYPVN